MGMLTCKHLPGQGLTGLIWPGTSPSSPPGHLSLHLPMWQLLLLGKLRHRVRCNMVTTRWGCFPPPQHAVQSLHTASLGKGAGGRTGIAHSWPFRIQVCPVSVPSCSQSAITHKAFFFLHLEGSCFWCGVTGGAGLAGHSTACSLAPWSRVASDGSPCAGSDAGEVL